jgi:hypothetical protein
MKEDTVHVLVAMGMIVPMVMAVVVMTMLKAENPDQVDQQASKAYCQQFAYAVHFTARGQTLHRLIDDFHTDDPGIC